MEQSLTEMTPSDSTISDLSKEVKTNKRPHFTAAGSDLGISSGNSISVQAVEKTTSSHERPRKKRHYDGATHCCPKDSSLCKESGSVSDAYTQADHESSFSLKEESLRTCQGEVIDTIDMELKKRSSAAGVLQNINSHLPKESLRNENVSQVNNPTNTVPDVAKADTIESTVRRRRKKLLILDVNGLLVDIVPNPDTMYEPDAWISRKAVYKRAFCTDFLEFCFDKFEVGVWSSRNRKNLESAINFLMGDKQKKLAFCWDQSHCTNTGYKTMKDRNKPLFLKEIAKLWDKEDPNLPWQEGDYDESNTLLIDDSPYKALLNPPNTGVFPYPYDYRRLIDYSLGRKGRLRKYLERLAEADNVQEFVSANWIGQRPINRDNVSCWRYYARIYYAVCARHFPSEASTSAAIEDKRSTTAVTEEDVVVTPYHRRLSQL